MHELHERDGARAVLVDLGEQHVYVARRLVDLSDPSSRVSENPRVFEQHRRAIADRNTLIPKYAYLPMTFPTKPDHLKT